MVDKELYNCVLSQVFSPDGDLLVCGNIYGDLAVFDIRNVLDSDSQIPKNELPTYTFSSPNQEQICSLTASPRFLIAGTVEVIYGWTWDSVRDGQAKVAFTIQLPAASERIQKTDVNTMFLRQSESNNVLFTGCGDNMIYAFSLEDGSPIRTFKGHTDYIHSVCCFGSQMASAGEDGAVKLWDLRQKTMTNSIEPYKNASVARQQYGKYVGDVAINNDWLLCGGGPKLGLWHMRTLALMSTFPDIDDRGIHVTRLQADSVLAGGASDYFYQADYTGQIVSKLSPSAPNVYTALFTDSPQKVLSLAGSGNRIDICTNFTYRHKVLHFSKLSNEFNLMF